MKKLIYVLVSDNLIFRVCCHILCDYICKFFENPTVIQNEKNRLLSVILAKSLHLKSHVASSSLK